MNEEQLKIAAFLLAEKTPDHLGNSAYPPQKWIEVVPGIIRVLMADGRSIRAPLADLLPPPTPKQVTTQAIAPKLVALPVHKVSSSLRDKPAPKKVVHPK